MEYSMTPPGRIEAYDVLNEGSAGGFSHPRWTEAFPVRGGLLFLYHATESWPLSLVYARGFCVFGRVGAIPALPGGSPLWWWTIIGSFSFSPPKWEYETLCYRLAIPRGLV